MSEADVGGADRGRFSGKRAVVTGAASGIGAAVGRRLLGEGASLVVADINAELLDRTWIQLPEVTRIALDVSAPESVLSSLAKVTDALGGVDVLVHSAAITGRAEFLEIELAQWNKILDINLTGAFLMGQTYARAMAAQGGGSIVNISSVKAQMSGRYNMAYAVSKAGLWQLTKSMSVALADANVRVNAVGPGPVETPINKNTLANPDVRDRYLTHISRRRFGKVDDIAAAVAFLASDEADFINGITIYVDGGLLAADLLVSP